MESKIKQALEIISKMIIEENNINKNNVFNFNLSKLVKDFGVKKTYQDFVVMSILTNFEYHY
jgi:hypothetical protein